ncbi:MGMT family protein [Streptomyces durocortorensis]|uniref:MGMT family protein n=1 Tax=Streptomyces durocortorensis TaxID=2811104 RepID=UPI0027DABB53|nr:MGMT family protein [Streptomyces durocortorensis]
MTGRTADGIQGTTWWDVDTAHVPADVDPDAWATLAGSDLTGLARQLSGTRKDWTGLHTLLSGVPAGRWTTYGDLAAAVGSHAVPIGQHLGTCGRCPNPWRVLTAAGKVSPGFQWPDPSRTDTAASLLIREGVRFDGDTADPDQRLRQDELRHVLDG